MNIPNNIDEAMQALIETLSVEDQIAITRMTEDEVGGLHHSLGQWIRNNWGLWSGGPLQDHMTALGFIHADDMSGSLLREFWARMNHLPSKIAEEVEEYKKYWAKELKIPLTTKTLDGFTIITSEENK
jgi:hypothetical protein